MLQLDNNRSKKIDSVFVIALFTMFAVTAFLLILIGAKQYKHTADAMDENYELRTVSSYLMEKVRQNDVANSVSIINLEGTPALCICTTQEGITFYTYIYYYENALREIMVTESSVFSLDSAQSIMQLQGFSIDALSPQLLKVYVTTSDSETHTLYINLHSYVGKEAL